MYQILLCARNLAVLDAKRRRTLSVQVKWRLPLSLFMLWIFIAQDIEAAFPFHKNAAGAEELYRSANFIAASRNHG